MASPVPKAPGMKQRRNKTTTAAVFEMPPAARPDLPDGTWHKMTLAWWTTIWDSPMAGEWVDADMPGLMIMASLIDQFWTTREPKVAAEIRMQQREYGLSPLSRRQLQWEVKRIEAVKKPPVVIAGRAVDPRRALRSAS